MCAEMEGAEKMQNALFLHFFAQKFFYINFFYYLCTVFPTDLFFGVIVKPLNLNAYENLPHFCSRPSDSP